MRLFTELLAESYVNNIESYSGEKILYGREVQEQEYAEVDAKLVTKRGEEIPVDYRLHKVDGDWKVYDVVIENISLVNNYRAKDHESHMTFLGFLIFSDPVKPEIVATISELERLGISLKVISGDNHRVAAYIGSEVGLTGDRILTGPELREMGNEALAVQARDVDIFAEVEPNQKERIILALKKSGNVVGFMGDGINDASALHAADVGISVDSAVDVAKEAADIVLLEKNLQVLVQGVQEGRTTFANTLKYVFMATSANFGNMFSVAGASLFLPFLPLLPKADPPHQPAYGSSGNGHRYGSRG